MTASAVYEGTVRHRRFEPVEHEFSYRLFLMYLDLDELPGVLDPYPLLVGPPPRPRPLPPRGLHGRPGAAAGRVRARRGRGRDRHRPAGPVRLLAGLRYLGHSFNPVSFYYCFDSAGERVEAVVADVENIPWGERHAYVLARGEREGPVLSDELDKSAARLAADGDGPDLRLPRRRARRAARRPHRVAPAGGAMTGRPRRPEDRGPCGGRPAAKSFDATLSLRRRELSRPLMARLLARYPAMSLQVVAKIYAQSLRLKLKGARYLPHPEGSKPKGFVAP